MTICAAIKVQGTSGPVVFIGADSNVSYGDMRLKNLINYSKIVKYQHFAVALCGEGPMREALLLQKQRWANKCLNTELDVLKFAKDIYKTFQKLIKYANSEEESKDWAGQLLIATSRDLFLVIPSLETVKCKKFVAIGSGSEICTGVLETLYPKNKKSSNRQVLGILKQALKITIDHRNDCGQPVKVLKVS